MEEAVHTLHLAIEACPERKGAIALEWFSGLPKSLRVLGSSVYAISKERGVTEQTFNISGQVGNLNLGQQYGAITNTVTSLANGDAPQKAFAEALQKLAEGVKENTSLRNEEKASVLEGLNDLGEQASQEQPKRFTVAALLKSLPFAFTAATDLTKLWSEHGQVLVEYFHHLIP